MCMLYEDEYKCCFDHLFLGVLHESWLKHLEDGYYVKINNPAALQVRILNAIAAAHVQGEIESTQTKD